MITKDDAWKEYERRSREHYEAIALVDRLEKQLLVAKIDVKKKKEMVDKAVEIWKKA